MSQLVTLSPVGGCGYANGNMGISALKSISFFLLFTGIILIAIGYIRQENRIIPPRVEYRYIPRTFQEEQSINTPILSVYGKMFSDRGPWEKANGFVDTYPWQRHLINNKIVLPNNNPNSGLGRAVGERIIG